MLGSVGRVRWERARAVAELQKIQRTLKVKIGYVRDFVSISEEALRKWSRAVQKFGDQAFGQRGRKAQEEFEAEVLSKLMFVSRSVVQAHVCHARKGD
jgi:hypothetical protein